MLGGSFLEKIKYQISRKLDLQDKVRRSVNVEKKTVQVFS